MGTLGGFGSGFVNTREEHSMKVLVAVMKSFGAPEVLEFEERTSPPLASQDFLVKGQFASVSTGDVRIRSKNVPRGFGFIMSLLFGFRKPKFESLGTDYAGEVIQVGESVKDVQLGDRVVVDLGMGLNGYRTSRVIGPKQVWAKIPDQVSSDAAVAAVFGGLTAMLYLKNKLKVKSQEKVLVIGAGGAVGSSAVQLAKFFGADVVGVCSAGKAEVVRGLGASRVLDYNSKDWEQSAQNFDVVLDCVGVLDISSSRKFLNPKGRVGFVVADLPLNLKCVLSSALGKQVFVAGAIQSTRADLQFLMDLIAQGKYQPLIGKRFSFSEVVEAHREVESGHRLGTTLLEF